MSYKVTEHIPNLFKQNPNTPKGREVILSNIKDILKIEWVDKFTKHKYFVRFSISPFVLEDTKEEGFYLIADKHVNEDEELPYHTWDIVAKVIGSTDEALNVFPTWHRKNDRLIIDI